MQGVQLPRCPSVDLQSRRAWKEAGTQGHDGTRRANTGCPVLLEALYSVATTLCGRHYSAENSTHREVKGFTQGHR